MSAIAIYHGDEGRSALLGVWRFSPATLMPGRRQCVAICLVIASISIPDACMHAKWSRLSLVTGLAFHRYVAPST